MSATSPSTVSEESPRVLSRELVMLLCVLALVVMLALTALLSRLYHKKIHSLADAMFAQGEADEQAGQVKAALTDYRNALAYNPTNPLFQFHLAKALAAAKRDEEARSYLLNLLSESPGSGEVNLELARIAAHAQFDGGRDALLPGRDLRRMGQRSDGNALGSAPGTLRNPAGSRRSETGRAGSDRARGEHARRRYVAPENRGPIAACARSNGRARWIFIARCWPLTGMTKNRWQVRRRRRFELGQYITAMEYFDRLPRERREQPDLANLFTMTSRILAMDPFLSGLSAEVRAQRDGERAGAGANTSGKLRAPNRPTAGANSAEDRVAASFTRRARTCSRIGLRDTWSDSRIGWTPRWRTCSRWKMRPRPLVGNRRAMIARCGCWAAAGRW